MARHCRTEWNIGASQQPKRHQESGAKGARATLSHFTAIASHPTHSNIQPPISSTNATCASDLSLSLSNSPPAKEGHVSVSISPPRRKCRQNAPIHHIISHHSTGQCRTILAPPQLVPPPLIPPLLQSPPLHHSTKRHNTTHPPPIPTRRRSEKHESKTALLSE